MTNHEPHQAVILLAEDREDDVLLVRRALVRAEVKNPLMVVRNGEEVVAYLEGTGKYSNREHFPVPDLLLLDEPTAGMNPADQWLLETAARLQDVGYLINYEKHHKHSYHLILNSGLPGIEPRELELIANVARYHRGARPKRRHENFRQLPAEDHEVLALDGIFKRIQPTQKTETPGRVDFQHAHHGVSLAAELLDG